MTSVGSVMNGRSGGPAEDYARAYLQEIKDSFDFHDQNGKYDTFIQIMKDYLAKRIGLGETIQKVKELFEGYNQLILGLNAFLPHENKITLPEEDKLPSEDEVCLNFVRKVKARFGKDSDEFHMFYNGIKFHRKGMKIRAMVHHILAETFKDHEDLLVEFNHMFGEILELKSTPDSVKQLPQHSEKEVVGPLSQLDLSNCEQCTPSYRRLPQKFIVLPSKRTELDAQVLNDEWISTPRMRLSLNKPSKNENEEILSNCENDKHELDILIEQANYAEEQTEELINKINTNVAKVDGPFRIEDHFTATNLRVIQQLYAENKDDMMLPSLRENPSQALPVILSRLRQKQVKLRNIRRNTSWVELYAKNYHKSLDERKWYFEEQDRIVLSDEALLSEIKENREKERGEENILVTILCGDRSLFVPHLEYEYTDPEVHQDMYQIIKYSCGEAYTYEEVDKVLKMWRNLLEPILGVTSQPHGAEEDDMFDPIKKLAKTDFSKAKGLKQIIALDCAKDAPGPTASPARPGNVSGEERPDLPPLERAEPVRPSHDERAEGEIKPKEEAKDEEMFEAGSEAGAGGGEGGGGGDGTSLLVPLHTKNPLEKHDPSVFADIQSSPQVFYGNDSIYILFRLHQILYERLQLAKINSILADEDQSRATYNRFLTELYNLLDGFSDKKKFEDQCQDIFGTQSYLFLTIDKMIYRLVKQLKAVAHDEMNTTLVQLYEYEKLREPGRFIDKVYQANAWLLLHDKNIYRFECTKGPPTTLCIELLDKVDDDEVKVNSTEPDDYRSLYTMAKWHCGRITT